MTLIIPTFDSIGTDPQLLMTGAGDRLILGAGLQMISTGSDAIWSNAAGQTFEIYGVIRGAGSGLALGGFAGPGAGQHRITIHETGQITGATAIELEGAGNLISNAGQILGSSYAIDLGADDPGETRVVNDGLIAAGLTAIRLSAYASAVDHHVEVVNRGSIIAGATALGLNNPVSASFRVSVTNSGLIEGNVFLGGGNSLYDGRGGILKGTATFGAGDDTVMGGDGAETFHGGDGLDTLDYRHATGIRLFLDGSGTNGAGALGDQVTGFEWVSGSLLGADLIVGDAVFNVLEGWGGNDTLKGQEGGDYLTGMAGNDRLYGGIGADSLEGGDGDDLLDGGVGADQLEGGAGNDRYVVDDAGDVVLEAANDGIDQILSATRSIDLALFASVENAALTGTLALIARGTAGANALAGNVGANILRGFAGVDTITGGAGSDRIEGGAGADLLAGGTGNDSFVFLAKTEGGDRISDFHNALGDNDRFLLEGSAFGFGAATGAIAANRFVTRADNLAQDADDRFIFRTTDRTLWFDANGNAVGGLTLLADLQFGAVVTAADIVLV